MINILCYGDSNTYGYIPGFGGERYEKDVRWTGVLQNLLGSEYNVIEEGLGGRTTVWDDPIEEYKNGKNYLIPCLQSHKPLDLVIIMLGTNDSKVRFSVPACDIADGMENLVVKILNSSTGRNAKAPEILLVAPIRIGKLTEWTDMLSGAKQKMEQLPEKYLKIATKYRVAFLDAGSVAVPSELDGVHLDAQGHTLLARKIFEIITE